MLIFIQGTIDNVGDFFMLSFILTHISLDLLFLGCAKAYIKWETKRLFDGELCQKYLSQKVLKSDNWFLSYSRKCRGYSFETQCK